MLYCRSTFFYLLNLLIISVFLVYAILNSHHFHLIFSAIAVIVITTIIINIIFLKETLTSTIIDIFAQCLSNLCPFLS